MEHDSTESAGTSCPLCGPTDGARCQKCGLWWGTAHETFSGSDAAAHTSSLRIRLRSEVSLRWVATLLAFGGFALGSASVCGLSLIRTPPNSLLAWLAVLVALLLGALVGTYFAGALAQVALHARLPSQLSRDGAMIRVQVWHTWDGLWRGFRRTDALVPRAQLCGVEFMVGQGGETHVFLAHASGRAFGTGWRGSRKAAMRLAEELSAWLAAHDSI